jgi:hypothetical protein
LYDIAGAALTNVERGKPTTNYQIVFGDFNGDGKTDILAISQGTEGPIPAGATLYLSTGVGFASGIAIPNSSTWWQYNVYAGDWNGDGKSDLLLVAQDSGSPFSSVGMPHQLWLSTGTGFTQALNPSGNPVTIVNSSSSDNCGFGVPSTSGGCIPAEIADWNNDGASDILLIRNSGNAQFVFSYVPELITTVSNGLGATSTVTYNRINQNSSLYTKCPASPGSYLCGDAYPTQAVDGPVYVVSRIDASNGLGTCTPPSMTNCYSTTYAYGGYKKDLSGRGFLGFQQTTQTDLQTGIVTTSNYLTAFPYIGYLASQTEVTTSASANCTAGVTLKSITNTPGAVNLGGTRNFVFTSATSTIANDCNGAPFPTVTTTNHYDCQDNASSCYGELKIATESVAGGVTQTITRSYADDTTDWCFDEPTATTDNRVLGSSSNITRNSTATYSACLLTQDVEEPGASDPTQISTTNYTYDGYGNATQVAVTACVWSSGS